MSRRVPVVLFAVVLIVAPLATASIGLTAQSAPTATTPSTFHVMQGGECHEVAAIGDGTETVTAFYDYRTPNTGPGAYTYSSHGTTEYQENQVSNLFIYHGSKGYSLVMLHDKLGDGPHGSTITFDISGLPSSRTWAVEDDSYGNNPDDTFIHNETSSLIDWRWAPNRTDGAAVRGLASDDYDAVTIDPRFNEDARPWGNWTYSGEEQHKITTWRFLDDSGTVTEFDMSQSVTIAKGGCPDEIPPSADLSVSTESPVTGTDIEFDGSGSSDNDEIASYEWQFGDGTTATGKTVTHSYTAPGEYSVTLTVTDTTGKTDTATTTITVESPDTNKPPTADAGTDQTVDEQATVTLDGTASADPDGDTLSYTWTKVSGPKVDLSGADTATPTFTAPEVNEPTTATFKLTVADGHSHTATDTVTVTVTPTNEAPTAEAGTDQTATEGTTVTLDGSASTDPDGDELTYAWEQTDDGPTVTLTDAETATPKFTAPDVSTPTTLMFELTVTDSNGSTATDTVTVTVEPESTVDSNDPPTADAGADKTVDERTSVTLDASGSADPDGDTLTYTWEQTGGEPAVTLTNTGTATPEFTTPDVNTSTTLTFELTVADGHGHTATDTVTVTVKPESTGDPNAPPTAETGPDRTVNEQTSVTLDASGSADPDGDELTYTWTQTGSGPTVGLSDADTVTPTFTAPTVEEKATVTFTVQVSDSHGQTATDTVTVTVTPVTEQTTERSMKEALVDRIERMAADDTITRSELKRLASDVTGELVRLLRSIMADGDISKGEIKRLAEAIAN